MSTTEEPTEFGHNSDYSARDARWGPATGSAGPYPGHPGHLPGSPPTGYPHPKSMATGQPNAGGLPSPPTGAYSQPFGPYPTLSREAPLVRRHLGAIIIAATILVVGLAGIGAWTLTSTVNQTPASTSYNSPASSSGGLADTSSTTGSAPDQRFMSVLQNGGFPVTSTNRQDFVTVGHNICGMLAEGYTTPPMITYLTSQKGYSSSQAATFVGASIGAYCPEFQ